MKKINILFISVIALLLISCGAKNSFNSFVEEPAAMRSVVTGTGFNASKKSVSNSKFASKAMEAIPMYDYAEECEADGEISLEYYERKLIKTGNVNLEVDSFDNIEDLLSEFVAAYKGYITDTTLNEYSYYATIKIPAVSFEDAMSSLGNLGKIKYKSENSRDVTEEFYDLESRLETKKILKEKFESYLKKANDMKELLEIEKQLNEVIADLDAMESHMKRLSGEIEYSTIYINMNLPVGYVDSGYNWPDMGEKMGAIGYNLVNFLAGFLMVVIYSLIFGIPVIAAAALLYWLLFGKVGLLIKLFKALSKRKTDK